MRRLVVLLVVVLGLSTLAAVPGSALAGPAAEPCHALGSGDVRYTSPPQSGSIESGGEECFTLPDGSGTVYNIAANVQYLSAFEVRDADGVQICDDSGPCRLEGPAPFHFRMVAYAQTPYELQIFRITGDHGCPPLAIQPFGSTQEVTGHLDGALDNCWSFELPEGGVPLFNSAYPGRAQPYVQMYDAGGEELCLTLYTGCEGVPEATNAVVITGGISGLFDPPGGNYRFTLGNAASSTGCLPEMDTSWTAPAAARTALSSTQLDCWMLPSSPGEPITFATRAPAGNVLQLLLDADGRLACNDDLKACRPSGRPPYRYITTTTYAEFRQRVAPTTYRAAVRSLAAASGCPLITPRPFGTPATDRYPGNGCRQFDVLPGHDYYATPVDPRTRQKTYGSVLDVDLRSPEPGDGCFPGRPVCHGLTGGRHWLIADVIEADTVTALHDTSDLRGCGPLATDMTQATGPQALASVDCYAVGSAPGNFVGVISTAAPSRDDAGYRIVDASGKAACDYSDHTGYCKLTGPPPHRLMIGEGSSEAYVTAVVDAEDPPDCSPVALGHRRGRLVQVTGQDRIACFTAATGGADGVETVHMQRIGGDGGGLLEPYPTAACQDPVWYPSPSHYAPASTMMCSRPTPADSYSFVVIGDGGRQTYYVERTARTEDPHGNSLTRLYVRGLPGTKGRAQVGSTLRAVPGRWIPDYGKIRYRYQWLRNDRVIPGAKGSRLLMKRRYAGSEVRVLVTATSPHFDPGFAFSPPVRVRRR